MERGMPSIATIAGTGEAGYSGDGGPGVDGRLGNPFGLAIGPDAALYFCEIGNHSIRRVDLASGGIDTFAGTGGAEETPNGAPIAGTPLNGPRALAFEASGDMLVALREGNAVYRVDMGSRTLEHVAGTGMLGYSGDEGAATEADLSGPKGIAVAPSGGIYIADTESHTIQPIDGGRMIMTVAGDGTRYDGPDGDPAGCGFSRPHGIFVDEGGSVYGGDSGNHRARRLR
jgi:DNA-binding beta-propeller fold protein YncE